MLVLYGTEWLLSYPASGLRERNSGAFGSTGSSGSAWSSALADAKVYRLFLASTVMHSSSINSRAFGFPVRCVQNLLLFKSNLLFG